MKKRYMMTLSQEHVEGCHAQLKRLGLGKPALSAVIDDWLGNFEPVLTRMADAKSRGEQLTFEDIMSDLFVSLGKAMKP